MFEELQEFWNEYIERTIQSFRVQSFSRVLAYLLQSAKSSLQWSAKSTGENNWYEFAVAYVPQIVFIIE